MNEFNFVSRCDNMQPLSGNCLDYILKNKSLDSTFKKYGFFPWLDKEDKARAYVVENPRTYDASVISDFYLQPEIHITGGLDIRIATLYHINPAISDFRIVFKSTDIIDLKSFKTLLIKIGAYNFWGSASQFSAIMQAHSYDYSVKTSLLELI